MIYAQLLLLAFILARLLPRRLAGLVLPLCLAALIPFDGVSAIMVSRSLWGDPSITSLQLLVIALAGARPAALCQDWLPPALIAATGSAFYALALGSGPFDPYRYGYQPVILVVLLALAALYLWRRGQSLWLWLLVIDLLAFALGLPESTNLWDTLLDPLLILACGVLAVRNGLTQFKRTS